MRADGRDLGSRYLLADVIGQGGCGVVWRAIERDSGQHVAVKVLRRDLADVPGMLAQFVAEAEILQSVHHPHVLAVRDVVIEGGDIALVSDLIDGPTLRSVLDREGPLAGPEASMVAAQLAAGLAAVHAAGIVHADLKPQNVLLGTGGVRLADFGLARIVDGAGQVGSVRGGSRNYQAPEVVRGGEPTPSADVFAFGLVLYEAWTGTRPRKRVPNARERAHLAAAAAVEYPELAQTLLAALATDPKRRPAARTLATRLAGIRGADRAVLSEDSAAADLPTPAQAPPRLPVAAGDRGFGPLIEQYPGDSRPTVLEGVWQRPPQQPTGVATRDYRRQRWSRGCRALLSATAVVLAVVGAVLGYGSARDADASDTAAHPAAWERAAYPAPTGWLCATSADRGAAVSGFRLEVCVLADSDDHVIGRIRAELVSGTPSQRAERVPIDLRIRLGAANGSAELTGAECALVLTAARPADGCSPIDIMLSEPAAVRAFGTGRLHSEIESSQLVSTPAVMIRPRSVS